MSERLSALWQKLFCRVVKTAFDVSMGSYWKAFLRKNQIIFITLAHWANLFRHSVEDFPLGMLEKRFNFLIIPGHWVKNFRPFVIKVEAGLPELLFTCLQEEFEKYIFLKKVLRFFFLFRTLSENFSAFCQLFWMELSLVNSTCP